METESCHSNQSSYLTGTKNNVFVEANARNMYAKYQLHKAVSERGFLKIFFRKFALSEAPATNQNKQSG